MSNTRKIIVVFLIISLSLVLLSCSEPQLPEPPSLPDELSKNTIENSNPSGEKRIGDIPPPPPLPE